MSRKNDPKQALTPAVLEGVVGRLPNEQVSGTVYLPSHDGVPAVASQGA